MAKADHEESSDSEDEGGLEFIDPAAIEKERQAEALANKEREQKPKMVKINGKLVPASSIGAANGQSGLGITA